MIVTLIIPQHLRAQLADEAGAAFPHECCGLIEGVREGDGVRVLALHPTANFGVKPDRFEIDPAAHIGLLRGLRGTGREIVGCYHSHPGGRPALSDLDRENGGEEGFVWLIAALGDGAGPAELSAFEGATFHTILLTE